MKIKTRREIIQTRAYWREKKRESRSKKSDKQRRLEREAAKEEERKNSKDVDLSAVKTIAEQIESIFSTITPRKRQELSTRGIVSPKTAMKHQEDSKIVQSLVKEREQLKYKRDTKSLKTRRCLSNILLMPYFEDMNENNMKNEEAEGSESHSTTELQCRKGDCEQQDIVKSEKALTQECSTASHDHTQDSTWDISGLECLPNNSHNSDGSVTKTAAAINEVGEILEIQKEGEQKESKTLQEEYNDVTNIQYCYSIFNELEPILYSEMPESPTVTQNLHPGLKKHYKPVCTTGDGNCLWNMVSIALTGNEECMENLRELTTTFIHLNMDHFIYVLEHFNSEFETPITIESLIDDSCMEGRWGCEFHLYALSMALERPIYIYCPQTRKDGAFWDEHLNGEEILLKLQHGDRRWRGHLRYEGIRCSEGKRPICGFFQNEHYTALLPVNEEAIIFPPYSNIIDVKKLLKAQKPAPQRNSAYSSANPAHSEDCSIALLTDSTNAPQEERSAPSEDQATALITNSASAPLKDNFTAVLTSNIIALLNDRTIAPKEDRNAPLVDQDSVLLNDSTIAPQEDRNAASEDQDAVLSDRCAPLEDHSTSLFTDSTNAPQEDRSATSEDRDGALSNSTTASKEDKSAPLEDDSMVHFTDSTNTPQEDRSAASEDQATALITDSASAPLQDNFTAVLTRNTIALQEDRNAPLEDQDSVLLNDSTIAPQEDRNAPLEDQDTAFLNDSTIAPQEDRNAPLEDQDTVLNDGTVAPQEDRNAPLEDQDSVLLNDSTIAPQEDRNANLEDQDTVLNDGTVAPQVDRNAPIEDQDTALLNDSTIAPQEDRNATSEDQDAVLSDRCAPLEDHSTYLFTDSTSAPQEDRSATSEDRDGALSNSTTASKEDKSAPLEDESAAHITESTNIPQEDRSATSEDQDTALSNSTNAPKEDKSAPLEDDSTAHFTKSTNTPQEDRSATSEDQDTALSNSTNAPKEDKSAPLEDESAAHFTENTNTPQDDRSATAEDQDTALSNSTNGPKEDNSAPLEDESTAHFTDSTNTPKEDRSATKEDCFTALIKDSTIAPQEDKSAPFEDQTTAHLMDSTNAPKEDRNATSEDQDTSLSNSTNAPKEDKSSPLEDDFTALFTDSTNAPKEDRSATSEDQDTALSYSTNAPKADKSAPLEDHTTAQLMDSTNAPQEDRSATKEDKATAFLTDSTIPPQEDKTAPSEDQDTALSDMFASAPLEDHSTALFTDNTSAPQEDGSVPSEDEDTAILTDSPITPQKDQCASSEDCATAQDITKKTIGKFARGYLKRHNIRILKQKARNKRARTILDHKTKVQNFYNDPSNVSICPEKKRVLKNGQPTSFMRKTLREAHGKLNCKVGFSTFCRWRPKNVKVQSQKKWSQCLCETCENFSYKVSALRAFQITKKDLLGKTLCKPSLMENDVNCIERKCDKCGTEAVLKELKEKMKDVEEIKWLEWTDVNAEKRIEEMSAKPTEFLDKLAKPLATYSSHLYNAEWQYTQYNLIRKHPQPNDLIIGMDFSQNLRTQYQNEIAAMHYGKYKQITVHPMVVNYVCPEDGCQEVVKESIIVFSDYLKHDCFAVKAFLEAARTHLTENRKIKIEREIHLSDNCGSQYKSRKAFYLLSSSKVPTVHSYFGSGHGKSLMDGEGAVVKKKITNLIKSEDALIRNASDCAAQFPNNVTQSVHQIHTTHPTQAIRTVMVVNDIQVEDVAKTSTIRGTQKLHCVRSTGTTGIIEGRTYSCFCSGCRRGINCENQDKIPQYTQYRLVCKMGHEKNHREEQKNINLSEKMNEILVDGKKMERDSNTASRMTTMSESKERSLHGKKPDRNLKEQRKRKMTEKMEILINGEKTERNSKGASKIKKMSEKKIISLHKKKINRNPKKEEKKGNMAKKMGQIAAHRKKMDRNPRKRKISEKMDEIGLAMDGKKTKQNLMKTSNPNDESSNSRQSNIRKASENRFVLYFYMYFK